MTNKKKNPTDVRLALFGNAPLIDETKAALVEAGFTVPDVFSSAPITAEYIDELQKESWDVFVVASFGALLPKRFLEIPKHGVINVHPSLLPRLRGPSPIRSAILSDEKQTGVSIMLLDEKMDQGPLLAQKKVSIEPWPPRGRTLDALLAREGAKLLAQVLPLWLSGEIEARAQNHDLATYCKAFTKEDGYIDLRADSYQNLLKIRAFEGWPGTYTFFERSNKKLRVQILDAHIEGTRLVVDTVKPEGKREMTYNEFLRSGATLL
jgi:methionyl-tRNA formyltransferase